MYDEKQKLEYRSASWKEKRKHILIRDGYRCYHCGEVKDEKKLQVHHLFYLDNRKIWDYPDETLITLCKRCHAEQHGKIRPSSGWEYLCFEDLGDLVGECEYCHTDIRYEHYIYHPDWGELIVGSLCADKLTSTNEASTKEEEKKRYANRMKRFIRSPRWKYSKTKCGYIIYRIKQEDYKILIKDYSEYCTVNISFYHPPLLGYLLEGKWIKLQSEKHYKTLDDAKIKVFELIESGDLDRYIKKVFLPNYYKKIAKDEDDYWANRYK